MHKSGFWKLAAPCLLIIAATLATPSVAGDDTADVVLGQARLPTTCQTFLTQHKLYYPFAVAIDTSATPNRLYVADDSNSRVLGWNDVTAFANGAPADLVIGQPDFYSTACNDTAAANPTGTLCATPMGSQWMPTATSTSPTMPTTACSNTTPHSPDAVRSPALGGPPIWCSGRAAALLRIPRITAAVSANSLNSPCGVAVDANGNLYVADDKQQPRARVQHSA